MGIIHVFLREPNRIILPKKDGYEGTRIMRAGRALAYTRITILIYDSSTLAPGEKIELVCAKEENFCTI